VWEFRIKTKWSPSLARPSKGYCKTRSFKLPRYIYLEVVVFAAGSFVLKVEEDASRITVSKRRV